MAKKDMVGFTMTLAEAKALARFAACGVSVIKAHREPVPGEFILRRATDAAMRAVEKVKTGVLAVDTTFTCSVGRMPDAGREQKSVTLNHRSASFIRAPRRQSAE